MTSGGTIQGLSLNLGIWIRDAGWLPQAAHRINVTMRFGFAWSVRFADLTIKLHKELRGYPYSKRNRFSIYRLSLAILSS
jgi:hypothetical protein